MKNLKRKVSAVVLSALFASMQISYAVIDTGLGNEHGGAIINNSTGGNLNVNIGNGFADLNFNGNSHVNWDSLNINKGESLNFNAVDGAKNLTILNTVNNGMTAIYGKINANNGIGQLIISNPNGMLFDGASFTTAGDLMLTTQNMSNFTLKDLDDLSQAKFDKLYNEGKLIPIQISNSTFDVKGDYTIIAAGINAAQSTINANNVRLVTANGQDYLALSAKTPTKDNVVTTLSAININGDLYITNDVGAMELLNGGNINGNVNISTDGNVLINKDVNSDKLSIKGDVDITGNGAQMFFRNAEVNGNLKMTNGGGFLDAKDIHVTKNATLRTEDLSTNNYNCKPVKHFVHVIGDSKVDGDLTIESKDNIHIGNYNYDDKKLLDGSLNVGGKLDAHAKDGHVMITVDTKADKISLKSDNLNVLTDEKTTLSANEYEFSANGYIGALKGFDNYTTDEVIISVMENYHHIPNAVKRPAYTNISGGKITKIETPNDASAYIASKGNVELTGAKAGNIYLTSYGKDVTISGNDVHAKEINVGKETDNLKVEFPSRDYTLKYTNIRDAKEVVINGNNEITYELTNGENGYNTRDPRPEDTTYLVGPAKPIDPPNPGPDPTPDPNPDPTINPDDNENIKVLRSYERQPSVDQAQPYTPVAYAADLDDDHTDTGVRKNVDGSVTVVRAFPMIN